MQQPLIPNRAFHLFCTLYLSVKAWAIKSAGFKKLYTFCDRLRSLETRVAVSEAHHLLGKDVNNFSSPRIVMYFALLPCFWCRLRLHKSRKSEQVWRAPMERKDFAATQPWQLKLMIFADTSHPLTTTSSFSTTTNTYSCSK